MKTKTDSFSKFITFCVLALFLITNMIFFTSCDNGNSPNDNTNEEQNNNVPTDYCEICDGVQTENCGIEHKCNDENCVEYADKKIYKNGHTHDYCKNNDCDGSSHLGADHPEYESWFQEAKIGGENSPIKIRYVNLDAQPDSGTATEKNQDRVNQYKKYIKSFTLNNELSNVKLDNTVDSFDALIGSTNENAYYDKNGINDVCAPAIEKITQNIVGSNRPALDKQLFSLYYKAISNEAYRIGYNGEITIQGNNEEDNSSTQNSMESKYIETKKACSHYNGNKNLPFESFYLENGKLNPEVVTAFDAAIQTAATKLGYEDTTELYKYINLSLMGGTIKGTHDYNASSINHTISDTCPENEMMDVIKNAELIAQVKLNKSIFSQDYGRELC